MEWDFHFDGVSFDVEISGPSTDYTYTDEYTGSVAVRVTDSGGHTAIASAGVWANAHPEIDLAEGPWTVTNLPGALKLDLTRTADASGIARYSWDFDGDDTFEATENSTTPTMTHVLTQAFDGPVRVRVEDKLGAWTEAVIPVKAYQNPTAAIAGGPFSTDSAPARFAMDGSGSSAGSGGAIVAYEWDWDADGQIEVLPGFPELSDIPASAGAARATSWQYRLSGGATQYHGQAKLTVIDAAGREDSALVPVDIVPVAEAKKPNVTVNGKDGNGQLKFYAQSGLPFWIDASAAQSAAGAPIGTVRSDVTGAHRRSGPTPTTRCTSGRPLTA
ncbi:hypothetical protein ACF064_35185 [Streptomyces sp. NPDC015492]|uniref:hypothetical protein n=1 Tax=Streptomyces sp. NPDC015492 TaxID=3364958 RepID=UPI0036F748BB